jgi:hypothetical protein
MQNGNHKRQPQAATTNGNEKRQKNNSSWFYRYARDSGQSSEKVPGGRCWLDGYVLSIHLFTYSPAFITAIEPAKKDKKNDRLAQEPKTVIGRTISQKPAD